MQVLVIGAGVVGLAVARAAARRGHDVVMAETESAIGTGTEVIHGVLPDRHVAGARYRKVMCPQYC